MAKTSILWFSSCAGGRDREGRIAGSALRIDLLWSPLTRNYLLRFAGEDRGRFKTEDEARTFASEHIDGWLAELQRAKAADDEHREAQRRAEESERRRLEGVINVFSNNGIPARVLEGLFLRVGAAEQLAAKLEERDRLADRLRELEGKPEH